MSWTPDEVAILGMSTTLLVAFLSALALYFSSKRDRRRALYSEAVQAILGWGEMLYRVRRRDRDQSRELISTFHDLQKKLSYYEAWIGSESIFMSRSYGRLIKAVKSSTEKLIQDAWKEEVRVVPGDAVPADEHPKLAGAVDDFLRDVRSHLSPFFWRKFALAFRNRDVKT
jgi:hypothetical protein